MRHFWTRSSIRLARAALLAAALVSCESPTKPEPDVTVSVVPSGTVNVSVGDTLTVRATVANATNSGVSFATSNALIATVDPTTGLVTALAAGEVTITATSTADRTATATVQLRVTDRPSSVVVEQILANGVLADYSAIRGVINVQLAVEVGSATLLQVLIDTAVVCQQSYGGPAAAGASLALGMVPTVCSYNTAEFNPTTGAPRFHNGPTTISARLLGADGRVRQQTGGTSIRLANRDTLVAEPVATKAAVDQGGLRWMGGDVTVTVLPVLYERNVSLSQVSVSHTPAGRATLTRTDAAAPFSVTFQEDSLPDVTDPALTFSVRSATSAGEVGPSRSTAPIRYDNRPPLPGRLIRREWIGAEVTFASTYEPVTTNADHGGVGRSTATFFAGSRILPDSALISRGQPVVRGADLRRSTFGEYRVAARVCDALDNCATASGYEFGVDLDAPTVETLSVPDSSVNPAADLVLVARDDLSGLASRPVEAIVTLLDADSATARCGPAVDGIDLPGRAVGAGCAPDTVGTTIAVPRTTQGYYSYSITLLDRAGNRSVSILRTFLVDAEAPGFTSVSVPAQLLPGEEGAFSAAATDNLDLTNLSFRLAFPGSGSVGAVALSFDTASTVVGRAFDATLTTTAARTTRFPLVRTLTSVIAGVRVTTLLDSLQVLAVDGAGLTRSLSRAIAPAVYGGNTETRDPFQAVTAVSPMELDAPGGVCTAGCLAGERTSVRLTLRIGGAASLSTQPFARVYFYRRRLSGGPAILIGSVGGLSAEGDVGGGQAAFRYSLTYTPPVGLAGSFDIFAVGVSSGGNALRNEPTRLEFFER